MIVLFYFLIQLLSFAEADVTLPSGRVVTDAQIAQIEKKLSKLTADKIFYHWTSNEVGARWAIQGALDKGEVDFYSRPTGNNQVYGPGIYLAESATSSSSYGNFPVVFKMKKGTLIYDQEIISKVLGKTLDDIDASALGQRIPMVRRASSGGDWWLFTHADLANSIDPGSLHNARPKTTVDWARALRESNPNIGQGSRELADFLSMSRYQDGVSFLRSNQTANPLAQFEPQNFVPFKQTNSLITNPQGPIVGPLASSQGTLGGGYSAASWARTQTTEVLPEIYKHLGNPHYTQGNPYRAEGVRAGGDEVGKTFIATKAQYMTLLENPYLELHYSKIPGSDDLFVHYFYPDVFHYQKLKGKISEDLYQKIARTPEAALWADDNLRHSLNQELVQDLLNNLFTRYHGMALDIEKNPTRVASFIQELISIHPFDDFSGRSTRLYLEAAFRSSGLKPPYYLLSDLDVVLSPEKFGEVLRSSTAAYNLFEQDAVQELMRARAEGRPPKYADLPSYKALSEGLSPLGDLHFETLTPAQMELVRKRQWVTFFDSVAKSDWRSQEENFGLFEFLNEKQDPLMRESTLGSLLDRIGERSDGSKLLKLILAKNNKFPLNPSEIEIVIQRLGPEKIKQLLMGKDLNEEAEELLLKIFKSEFLEKTVDEIYRTLGPFKFSQSTIDQLLGTYITTPEAFKSLSDSILYNFNGRQITILQEDSRARWWLKNFSRQPEDLQRAIVGRLRSRYETPIDEFRTMVLKNSPGRPPKLGDGNAPKIIHGYYDKALTAEDLKDVGSYIKYYSDSIRQNLPGDTNIQIKLISLQDQLPKEFQADNIKMLFAYVQEGRGSHHETSIKYFDLFLRYPPDPILSPEIIAQKMGIEHLIPLAALKDPGLDQGQILRNFQLLRDAFPTKYGYSLIPAIIPDMIKMVPAIEKFPDGLKMLIAAYPPEQQIYIIKKLNLPAAHPWMKSMIPEIHQLVKNMEIEGIFRAIDGCDPNYYDLRLRTWTDEELFKFINYYEFSSLIKSDSVIGKKLQELALSLPEEKRKFLFLRKMKGLMQDYYFKSENRIDAAKLFGLSPSSADSAEGIHTLFDGLDGRTKISYLKKLKLPADHHWNSALKTDIQQTISTLPLRDLQVAVSGLDPSLFSLNQRTWTAKEFYEFINYFNLSDIQVDDDLLKKIQLVAQSIPIEEKHAYFLEKLRSTLNNYNDKPESRKVIAKIFDIDLSEKDETILLLTGSKGWSGRTVGVGDIPPGSLIEKQYFDYVGTFAHQYIVNDKNNTLQIIAQANDPRRFDAFKKILTSMADLNGYYNDSNFKSLSLVHATLLQSDIDLSLIERELKSLSKDFLLQLLLHRGLGPEFDKLQASLGKIINEFLASKSQDLLNALNRLPTTEKLSFLSNFAFTSPDSKIVWENFITGQDPKLVLKWVDVFKSVPEFSNTNDLAMGKLSSFFRDGRPETLSSFLYYLDADTKAKIADLNLLDQWKNRADIIEVLISLQDSDFNGFVKPFWMGLGQEKVEELLVAKYVRDGNVWKLPPEMEPLVSKTFFKEFEGLYQFYSGQVKVIDPPIHPLFGRTKDQIILKMIESLLKGYDAKSNALSPAVDLLEQVSLKNRQTIAEYIIDRIKPLSYHGQKDWSFLQKLDSLIPNSFLDLKARKLRLKMLGQVWDSYSGYESEGGFCSDILATSYFGYKALKTVGGVGGSFAFYKLIFEPRWNAMDRAACENARGEYRDDYSVCRCGGTIIDPEDFECAQSNIIRPKNTPENVCFKNEQGFQMCPCDLNQGEVTFLGSSEKCEELKRTKAELKCSSLNYHYYHNGTKGWGTCNCGGAINYYPEDLRKSFRNCEDIRLADEKINAACQPLGGTAISVGVNIDHDLACKCPKELPYVSQILVKEKKSCLERNDEVGRVLCERRKGNFENNLCLCPEPTTGKLVECQELTVRQKTCQKRGGNYVGGKRCEIPKERLSIFECKALNGEWKLDKTCRCEFNDAQISCVVKKRYIDKCLANNGRSSYDRELGWYEKYEHQYQPDQFCREIKK